MPKDEEKRAALKKYEAAVIAACEERNRVVAGAEVKKEETISRAKKTYRKEVGE